MLVNIFGGLGSGKTLLLTILGYNGFMKGKKVYANYKTTFAQPITLKQILLKDFEPNSILLLDEIYTKLDSRFSWNKTSVFITHFIFQSRKLGVDIYATEQLRRSVDIRFRELADVNVFCEFANNRFTYLFIKDYKKFTLCLHYNVAKKFFTMYNTNEIIDDEWLKKEKEKVLKSL